VLPTVYCLHTVLTIKNQLSVAPRATKLNLFVKSADYRSGVTISNTRADLLANVVVKTQTRDYAQSKYFQLLTLMCEK